MINQQRGQRVAVIVLGPLDRSPRMLNHAVSFAENVDCTVDFIGYAGSSYPAKLDSLQGRVRMVTLSTRLIDMLKDLPRILYIVYALSRIIYQVIQLLWTLYSGSYDTIIVQNPPCIPIFLVLFIYLKMQAFVQLFTGGESTKLIIDWHNYGFTILEANGVRGLLISLARWYELALGSMAHAHLTVSKAFKKDIIRQVNVPQVHVLYDLAVEGKFRKLNEEERAEFLSKVDMGQMVDAGKMKRDRPLILITSTSYTPDEDIGLLIEALKRFSRRQQENDQLPDVHLIVTGAGPLKKQFLAKFAKFNEEIQRIKIEAKWLEIDDYPKMVASADLGICMHMSSSGLDLPMKIVDLFSCKVPCLAYRYPAITELVKPAEAQVDGVNGDLFDSELELATKLENYFKDGLQAGLKTIDQYSENLNEFVDEKWDVNWRQVFLEDASMKRTFSFRSRS